MSSLRLISLDYKVFGKVQGVFFRKYTKSKAQVLEIRGFVHNGSDGTVVGTIQGESEKIEVMKNWLTTKGSPASRIDRCVFSNERTINDYEFSKFQIR